MRLLAFLPSEQLRRLRVACGEAEVIHSAPNATSLVDLAAREQWDMLVVDPEMAIETNRSRLMDSLSHCFRPVVVYTALTRSSARLIADFSARCLAAVVIRDYDDYPALLRNSLARVPMEYYGARMVERLGTNIDSLPVGLRRATLVAYCSAKMLRTVDEYASLTGLTRRSVDRRLEAVGLSPAKWIVASAQFLRAYPLITSNRISFAAVSRRTGYGSVRALAS
jgi:hypothetical protein